jgi:hypothetical protein
MPVLFSYANEARIVSNAPLQHEADPFLIASLQHYFGAGNKWHFYSLDNKRRNLVSLTSKVIDKHMKMHSKLNFMTAKKA